MKYLIGIDIGTSAVKTVLFDEKLNKISSSTIEYPLYQPQNGWAEQNPEDWWNATLESIQIVTENLDRVDGIGLSGQMHGLVMLDGDGNVLRPAIIWCDQRTEKECAQITDIVGREKLINITANPALTGFTASKIMWVKNNQPEIYDKCRHILLPKDYIRYKLTGVFASEVSDAGGMQLLDIKNRVFSDEILRLLGIERELLPDVYESNFYSLLDSVNNLDNKLSKLNNSTSSDYQRKLLLEASSNASEAEISIASLPLSQNDIEETVKSNFWLYHYFSR